MSAMTATLPRRRVPSWLSSNRIMLGVSGLIVLVTLAAAVLPGVLAPGDPTALHPDRVLQGPGQATLLGTDQYGRSVLMLLVHGARTAVVIGLSSVALAGAVGTVLGLLAGYLGGVVDTVLARLVDILMCFPGVLLALVITAGLGASRLNLILGVAVATMPMFARVMRGQVMAVRGRLFVQAARATGLPRTRVLLRHVLPNAIAPVVVLATVTVGTSIVLAASLSFLGLGPSSDVPDWGQLLSSGQPYLANAWWVSTFPGVALTLVVISVSLLGDWLRDRMDGE
jgi:peptide/nickel transport system permease protein